jgi:hypothetical protein
MSTHKAIADSHSHRAFMTIPPLNDKLVEKLIVLCTRHAKNKGVLPRRGGCTEVAPTLEGGRMPGDVERLRQMITGYTISQVIAQKELFLIH